MTISRDVIQRLLNVVNDTRRRLNTVESREYVLLTAVQTLTNKTLTTPTISNFTNATHDHEDAAGGGQLSLTAAVTGILPPANGGTGVNNDTRTLTINTNSGTLAFGAASKTLTINESLNLSGASGQTLTLTNSLTVQGGGDTILSSSGNYTLTIPATGTAVLLTAVQTLTNKTLTTPTISNFTNATHDHEDAAGGGQLSLTAAVTGILPPANGGTGVNNDTRTLTINTNSGTLAFGAASKTLTINESLNLSGASGQTLTLTNSLTVQGGGNTVLSSAGNYTLTIPKTGTVPVGTGTAGRIAEWVTDANTVQASTLAKTGAGVLTLSASGNFTLTIPATGTAALLGTANVFTESQNISKSQNTVTRLTIENTNAGTSAFADLLVTTGAGQGFAVQKFGSGSTAAWSGISINNWARFRSDTGVDGLIFTTGGAKPLIFGTSDTERLRIISNGNVGIGVTSPTARLHVEQASASGGQPTLRLRQAHLSEEFIRFDTTVGTGNPINTTALGAYYGRVRVWVEGVGAKWLALYD